MTSPQLRSSGQTITLETGRLAKQANGAVLVRSGDTIVLVTAVARDEARESQDFFPLTVDVEERMYAAGKIPGGSIERESRPSDKATLTARLIDRPLRPSFAKGFMNEVQIIATVLSVRPRERLRRAGHGRRLGGAARLRDPVPGAARLGARRHRRRRVRRQPDPRPLGTARSTSS